MADPQGSGDGPGTFAPMSVTRDPECVFCQIVDGQALSHLVEEDERTLAFLDIFPATPGHTLVVPRAHARDLLTVAPEDLAACAATAQRVAARMVDRLGADGVNLLNACGEAAWQSVFHMHLHVVPRYTDERDQLVLPWTPSPAEPSDLSDLADRIRA